jgi:hypothetical protein
MGARATTAVDAGGATGAETAEVGDVSSLPAELGSEFQGICEQAPASRHIAAAASNLLGSFSVNGLAFSFAKAAMVPMVSAWVKQVGDSEGLFSQSLLEHKSE